MGGIPLLYSSQEVGRQATLSFFNNVPIDWTQNSDMLATYKTMMAFYNGSDACKRGMLTTYPHQNVVCFKRVWGSEEVLIVANVRNNNSTFALPANIKNTNWNDALTNTPLNLTESIDLSAYQFYILKK
jgi:glycosidase